MLAKFAKGIVSSNVHITISRYISDTDITSYCQKIIPKIIINSRIHNKYVHFLGGKKNTLKKKLGGLTSVEVFDVFDLQANVLSGQR